MKKLIVFILCLLVAKTVGYAWIETDAYVRLVNARSTYWEHPDVGKLVLRETPIGVQTWHTPNNVLGVVVNASQGIWKYQIYLTNTTTDDTILVKEGTTNVDEIQILADTSEMTSDKMVLYKKYVKTLKAWDLDENTQADTSIVRREANSWFFF